MLSVIVGLGGFLYMCTHIMGKDLKLFLDREALMLLGIGPILVIFMSHSFLEFLSSLRTVFSMAFINQGKEMNQISNHLTHLSQAVRSDGVGVLAQHKEQVKNPLFRDGLSLILNGFTPEEIRHNLIAKINTRQNQYNMAANLFESLGKLCPGLGLLGTIIGLVKMLYNMNDPKSLGSAMALSLLATLYGLIFGSVLYLSICEKIKIYAEKTLQLDTMIMEGVLLLKDKKSGAHFRDVLNTYGSINGKKAVHSGAGGQGGNDVGQGMGNAPKSRMSGPGGRG
jgi:chemotaxis protein MotA